MNGALRVIGRPSLSAVSSSGGASPAPVVEDLAPLWAIDARRGVRDLIGAAHPTGTVEVLSPDNTKRIMGLGYSGDARWTTPHDDSWVFDGGALIVFEASSAVLAGAPRDSAGYEELFAHNIDGTGVWDAIEVGFYTAAAGAPWRLFIDYSPNAAEDDSGSFQLFSDPIPAPSSRQTYAVRLIGDNGDNTNTVQFFILDDTGGVTIKGRVFRLVSEETRAGTTDVYDTDTDWWLLAGAGQVWSVECYDGPDGDLMFTADPENDGVLGSGSWVSSTGETWTATGSLVKPVICPERASWLVAAGVSFVVADANALDVGTGDFTVAMVFEATSLASGASDFRMLLAKFNPANIGTTGVGWGFADYSPIGGLVFAVNDGDGLVFAGGAWTANVQHLVVATGARGGLLSVYVDDMTTPLATADMTGASLTLANTLDVVSSTTAVASPALLGAGAVWSRALSASERSRLSAMLGV